VADQPSQVDVPTVAFDQTSDELVSDPSRFWAEIRKCPVTYTPDYGGMHILGRFDAVYAAATDVRTYCSGLGVAIPPPGDFPTLLPIEADPPLHRDYRQILNPELAPQVITRYEPGIRKTARSLVDALVERGKGDLVTDYAGPIPRWLTIDLLGLPREDEPKLLRWVEIQSGAEPDLEGDSIAKFVEYCGQAVAARKADPSGDDLISVVVRGQAEGRPITDAESTMMVMLLIVGGLHTTTSALAGTFHWLAQHPGEWERLRADETLLSSAVDEFLRYTSPTTYIGRKTAADAEVGGCPIPAGSRVVLSYAAANRDPDQFDRPDDVILDRFPNHHMAFGMGPHRCVGSHLAKLMMRVAIEEFGRRIVGFRLDDEAEVKWVGGMARGIVRLPVVITDVTPADEG
jgi:cytochrome P450